MVTYLLDVTLHSASPFIIIIVTELADSAVMLERESLLELIDLSVFSALAYF